MNKKLSDIFRWLRFPLAIFFMFGYLYFVYKWI